MKKNVLILCIGVFTFYCSFSQNVGIGTTSPDSSAALDIVHTAKGLLVPRMTTPAMNAIPGPARGLMIYDSLANQIMVNVGNASAPNWQSLENSNTGWTLAGNNGINPANQFVGTIDNKPLRFRINNTQAGELNPLTKNIFWGLSSGQSNSGGFSNIAVGPGALNLNTNSSNLVAIGDSALFNNGQGSSTATDGTRNVAIGSKSLFSNTIGNTNTAIGDSTMFFNTNGVANTALGFSALNANISGNLNTAAGSQALLLNTGGFQNTAMGANALKSNTTGSDCTAVGKDALFSNTTGFVCTAMGYSTMFSNTSGQNNSAFGEFAMHDNTTGNNNTAVGNFALQFQTTGMNNTAIGVQALKLNATGQNNVAAGLNALFGNSIGNGNTSVGNFSMQSNTTGSNNTAIGENALISNTTGNQNTSVGNFSMQLNQTGSNNMVAGINALFNDTVGNNNTAIGNFAGDQAKADNNNTFIGFGANNTSGAVANNSTALGFGASITASNQVRLGNAATTSIGGVVGFSTVSDGRFKRNIQENVKGIDFIMKLRPVTYQLDVVTLNRKLNPKLKSEDLFRGFENETAQKTFTGFVAQEVEQAAKDAGYDFSGIDKPKNENDYYGLRYSDFITPMVKAMQEQQQIIEQLKKTSEDLRNQNADLLRRLEKLEASINDSSNRAH